MKKHGPRLFGVVLSVLLTAGLLSMVKWSKSSPPALASESSAFVAGKARLHPPPLPLRQTGQRFRDVLPPQATRSSDDCHVPSQSELRSSLLDEIKHNTGDLALQNQIADTLGLKRPKSVEQLTELIASEGLIAIGETESYYLGKTFADEDQQNRNLYSHALPSVKRFLDDLLGEGHRCFKEEFARAESSRVIVETHDRDSKIKRLTRKLRKNKKRLAEEVAKIPQPDPGPLFHKFIVNSLTRTEDYQKLILGNRHSLASRYAAHGTSDADRTPHTTGTVVDIGGSSLTLPVRNWLRARLAEMERRHEIVAIEEGQGGSYICFHVMVIPYSARLPDRFPVSTITP